MTIKLFRVTYRTLVGVGSYLSAEIMLSVYYVVLSDWASEVPEVKIILIG